MKYNINKYIDQFYTSDYKNLLYYYSSSPHHNRTHDVEDAIQSAMYSLLTNTPKEINDYAHFYHILSKLTQQRLATLTKSNAYNTPLTSASTEQEQTNDTPLTVTIDDKPDYTYLYKAINNLPPLQRDIISLKLQGYTQSEIAERTNTTRSKVRTQLEKAYSTLQEVLKWIYL